MPLVILFDRFFFIPPCFLKLPPGVSLVPPFRLLFDFKIADFYVISISQIGTNRLPSGTNRWPIGTKDKEIGSGHCEIELLYENEAPTDEWWQECRNL